MSQDFNIYNPWADESTNVVEDLDNQIYVSPEGYSSNINTSTKKSLKDLREDENFSERAERFLIKVGSNDNIFEYLRDADYSLSSAAVRAYQVGDWDDQTKEDYEYLKNEFDNTELDGFRERFGMVKDITIDVLADPLNVLAGLFAIPTGGASLAGRAALGTAAKMGFKKYAKAKLNDKAAVAKTGLPLLTAAEGATWGGAHDFFLQDIDVDLGIEDDIDYGRVGTSAGVGGIFGLGVGAGLVGASAVARKLKRDKDGELVESPPPKVQEKIDKFSNEDDINKQANKSRKQIEEETELDLNVISDGKKNLAYWFIANSFGKPTTEFLNHLNKSKTLNEVLAKFRYDYDVGVLKAGAKKARGQTYGELLGFFEGKYLTGLGQALQKVDFENGGWRQGWRAVVSKKQNDELLELLRDTNINTKNINQYKNKKYNGVQLDIETINAYKGIRNTLNVSYKDALSAGLFNIGTKFAEGYFPRVFKYSAIEKNPEKLKQLIIDAGHADPLSELGKVPTINYETGTKLLAKEDALDVSVFGIDFLKEVGVKGKRRGEITEYFLKDATPEQIARAKQLKAEKIVEDMLALKHTPFSSRDTSGAGGSFHTRRFTKIKDNDLKEFLEDDVQIILTDYFRNVAQATSRTKIFGKTSTDFENKFLRNDKTGTGIFYELTKSGMKPTEAKEVVEKIKTMHNRVTGLDMPKSIIQKYKFTRGTADFLKLSQQMAHLPFATISSITEPFLLLQRANPNDAGQVFKDILTSIGKETNDVVDRTSKFIQRAQGKTTKGIKALDDESWLELHKTGLALESSVQARLEGLAGEGLNSEYARIGAELFFKTNLLTQWTKAVQLASFTTGKRLIKQNAQQLATGKTLAGRTVSKENREYLTKQLNELGIDENKAVSWYNKHLDEAGKFDEIKANKKVFYQQDIQKGASRFTKEIILNPSVAEANRALWFSTPAAQLLVQFAGYPTVFNNTILKRFINEGKNNKMQVMPKAAATALLMTAIGSLTNTLRSSGANLKDYETGKDKPLSDVAYEGWRRWGGLGPFDYVSRFNSEAKRDVGGFTSIIKTFAGPVPQDAIDAVLYRKDVPEIIVTNLPFYQSYDLIGGVFGQEDVKKKLRASARSISSSKKETKKKKPKLFSESKFAKGGLVTNVPQVPQEPDERIDKMTGIPYDVQAGSIMKDEEERVLVNKGGLLNKLKARKTYQDGGSISEAVETVKESLRSMFLKAQRSWESDHGSLPIRTHDAREANKKETDKTFDIAYGHKINEAELTSGQIHGIKFIDNEGNFIPLTEEQKEYIQQKDNEVNVNLARKDGWDETLKKEGLSWDTIDEPYKLALEDLAYNVGGNKAGTKWIKIFKDIKNNDVKSFVGNLRRKDNDEYSAGLDNRAAKAAYAAGLIKNLEEAKEYGLELTNTNEIPSRTMEEE